MQTITVQHEHCCRLWGCLSFLLSEGCRAQSLPDSGDGSRREYGDDDPSQETSQCWSTRSPISQPDAQGQRCSFLCASPWEGCCGGRRGSGAGADRRSCWQAAVGGVAAALQHQLTFGELLPVPLRRSRGSAGAGAQPGSGAARRAAAGRQKPDKEPATPARAPLYPAPQPALSAFISSPHVYEGGFLLRAVAVPLNANGERVTAALRSPCQAISAGTGP